MNYKLLSTRQFEIDFKKLDKNFQDRIKSKMQEVAKNPERYKHMHFEYVGSCRIRIGKLRIVYSYDRVKMILYLEKIIFDHKY